MEQEMLLLNNKKVISLIVCVFVCVYMCVCSCVCVHVCVCACVCVRGWGGRKLDTDNDRPRL